MNKLVFRRSIAIYSFSFFYQHCRSFCDVGFFFSLSLFLQGLLLLQQLTKSNAAIQKIVAFENAFERLLDIITEEGSSDGGKKVLKIPQSCSYFVVFGHLSRSND